MNRTKPKGSNLTPELVQQPVIHAFEPDRTLLAILSQRRAVPVDELAAEFDQAADFGGIVRRLVAKGLVYLQAIEYIWGVELQVGLTEAGRIASRGEQRGEPMLEAHSTGVLGEPLLPPGARTW